LRLHHILYGSPDHRDLRSFPTRRSSDLVTLYPSFPLHEDYARLMGAEVTRIGLTPQGSIDVDALVQAVAQPMRLVLFANPMNPRSEEHTSELQSRENLVCRLLLEKKNPH